MMERISLGVFYLSGWFIFSTSGLHQYHYVAEQMNWTDAQTYCKEKYTDLATIENEEDQNQLNNMVSSVNNHVWIGLYSNIVCKWSDGYRGRGPESMNWQTLPDNKPDFSSSHQSCVDIDNSGRWWAGACSRERPFICYNGTQLDPQFVYISDRMNWSSAQRYCRENYIDLATAWNDTELQQIHNLVPSGVYAWIGLIGNLDTFWSDGSKSSFRYWGNYHFTDSSPDMLCVVSWYHQSGKWLPGDCGSTYPFVCHSIAQPAVKRQVVKLRMKLDDPSVDLNDPAVKAQLLKQFQDRLKEQGLSGVNLKWREQPDGEVFHKEGKENKKKSKKKTEL